MKSSSYPKAPSLSLSSGVNEHTITSINIAVYRLANQIRWKLYRESNPAAYTAESFTHCKKTGKHYLFIIFGGERGLVVRALHLQAGGPGFKSSSLPLDGFVFGGPEFNSCTLCK